MHSFFIKTGTGRKEIFVPSHTLVEKHKPIKSPEVKETRTDLVDMNPHYFEPKTYNRFMVKIKDEDDNIIIPSYIIKKINRPTFYYNWFNIRKSNPLEMTIYDPIEPSGMTCITNAIAEHKKWNIDITILGPIGDVVESWYLPDSKLKSIDTPPMDWSNSGDPVTITLTFKIKNVKC